MELLVDFTVLANIHGSFDFHVFLKSVTDILDGVTEVSTLVDPRKSYLAEEDLRKRTRLLEEGHHLGFTLPRIGVC